MRTQFVCVEGINLVCCVHGIEQSNLLVKLQNLVLSVMKQLPTFYNTTAVSNEFQCHDKHLIKTIEGNKTYVFRVAAYFN